MTLPSPAPYIKDDDIRHAIEILWREVGRTSTFGTYFATAAMANAADTANIADQLYYAQVKIPTTATITGIAYTVGGVQSGNVKAGLYGSTGTRVANATATLGQGAINTFQKVPFDATYAAAPGVYYAALIFSSGTSTAFHAVSAPAGSAAAGSFATTSTITPPTTGAFVPLMTTY